MSTTLSVDTDGISTCVKNSMNIGNKVCNIWNELCNVSIPSNCENTTIIENLETAKDILGTVSSKILQSSIDIQNLNTGFISAEYEISKMAENLLIEGRNRIIDIADDYLGYQYKYGADPMTNDVSAFDCSSFVSYVIWKYLDGEDENTYVRYSTDSLTSAGTVVWTSSGTADTSWENVLVEGDILIFEETTPQYSMDPGHTRNICRRLFE